MTDDQPDQGAQPEGLPARESIWKEHASFATPELSDGPSDSGSLRAEEVATSLDAYARALLKKLWITKGTRFEANRRLEKQHEVTHLAISTLSVYVICAALLELLVTAYPRNSGPAAALHILFPIATIAAPIFILVLEKHAAGKNYLVKAERMERSALKIQALHSELEFAVASGTATTAMINGVRSSYEAILQDFTVNHDNIAFLYFRSLHPEQFKTENVYHAIRQNVKGRFLHYTGIWAIPASLIVGPGLVIGYAVALLLNST